jgi:hypothetical protein
MKKIISFLILLLSPNLYSFEYSYQIDFGTRIDVYYLEDSLIVKVTGRLDMNEDYRQQILIEAQNSTHEGLNFILQAMASSDSLEPFTQIIDDRQSFHQSLCHKIGQSVQGIYIDQSGQRVVQSTILGSPELGCPGRCGPQCGLDRINRSQYTQECLNHDLCRRTLGKYLGPCSREFWLAVHSFFFAPNCQR